VAERVARWSRARPRSAAHTLDAFPVGSVNPPSCLRVGIIALTATPPAGVNAAALGAQASGAQRTLDRRRYALGVREPLHAARRVTRWAGRSVDDDRARHERVDEALEVVGAWCGEVDLLGFREGTPRIIDQ
jgi:hypothetical protein